MQQIRLTKKLPLLLILLTIYFSGTSQISPPVENGRKEAPGQHPAFKTQTRAPSRKTTTNFSLEVITDELTYPWGMDFLPNGDMIISEKPGSIRIVSPQGKVSDPVKGVPKVRYQGSGGMYDIKLDPNFSRTGLVFWSYVTTSQGEAMNCVASGRLSKDQTTLEDITVIYKIPPTQGGRFHFGSRMLFDQENMLLVTFGDRFMSGRQEVQQLNSALGKIIRIDTHGKPAQNNPFSGRENTLSEIWSVGHRNPQGLTFHPVTGELWESEHGPRGGDEINIIKKGRNYGWPIISYGVEYRVGGVNGTGLTEKKGMEQPVYYYDPATAPSGMTFYSGKLINEWKNNLFVAMLKGMHISRLVVDEETGKIQFEEHLLTQENERFRHITEGPDGALYVLTDAEKGRLYRIK